jgi:ketosteroid isomerase-like protein
MPRLLISAVTLLIVGCNSLPSPPLSRLEVQEFVRQYVAATNSGDASRLMELISRDPHVSSIGYGKIDRGWDEIRKSTDATIAETTRARVTLGTVEVTSIASDYALAVAPMFISDLQSLRPVDIPGGMTMVVKRTPEGIRLIHEHFSVGTP